MSLSLRNQKKPPGVDGGAPPGLQGLGRPARGRGPSWTAYVKLALGARVSVALIRGCA